MPTLPLKKYGTYKNAPKDLQEILYRQVNRDEASQEIVVPFKPIKVAPTKMEVSPRLLRHFVKSFYP